MTNENLQINIGANTQDLQAGLNQATQSVTNFGNALKSASKPTADATQSLVNLSRIAQDAPYGFIGISNNLNPMLESFQRLQKETGSSGEALKAMVAGLTGPAGIGVALGIVSSLLVVFGGKITQFFESLTSDTGNLVQFNEALKGIGSTFTSAAEKVNKVGIAFEEYHKGILTGKEALKVYNDELGKNFGIKNNINDAEETFRNKTAAYIEASLQRALADSASKKAAEELLNEKIKLAQGPKNNLIDYVVAVGQGGATKNEFKNAAESRLKDDTDASEKLIKTYKDIAQKAQEASDALSKSFNINLTPEKNKKEKDYTLEDQIAEIERAIELTNKWADSEAKLIDKMREFGNKNANIFKTDTSSNTMEDYLFKQQEKQTAKDKTPFEALNKAPKLPEWVKTDTEAINKNDKAIQEAYKDYTKFANTLSNDVTNGLMSAWGAIQKGESPLEALANMFEQIALNIAAMVIQATIFSALLAAFPALQGAFAAIGVVSKIAAHAEGGITTGPHLGLVGEAGPEAIMPLNKLGNMLNSTFNAGAMSGQGGGGNGQFVLKGNDLVLALNRSNYSLNLRRGA